MADRKQFRVRTLVIAGGERRVASDDFGSYARDRQISQ
jgi:hypothetical protein